MAEVDKNAIPSLLLMEGYDGIHIIYKMIEATQGKQDGEKALKAAGLEWESRLGPVRIDAKSRDRYRMSTCALLSETRLATRSIKRPIYFPMQPDYGRSSPPAK